MEQNSKDALLSLIRDGKPMTLRQQLTLTAKLSAPAILAQLSSFLMQYIDASMLGRLGANEAASVGLVSTTIWLFGGLSFAFITGFSVQVAHRIGANDNVGARQVLRQAITTAAIFAVALSAVGMAISFHLPQWLGGDSTICRDSSLYFFVYAATYPFVQIFYLSSSMLRCSGNMKIPSTLSIFMDVLDIIFNFILIFPTHHFTIGGFSFTLPGAGLGVLGAALGTSIAFVITGAIMMWYLLRHSRELSIIGEEGSFRPTASILRKAFKISTPMGMERTVMCGAQIATTAIVAPLGPISIAANSFGITAESLCYMPGYGVSDAATTLVGQSVGAGRYELMKRFAWLAVALGMGIMTLMGIVMYVGAPFAMSMMTPSEEVRQLGVEVLRIEAFAEPMFGAAIICYGVFVGAAKTVAPSVMNLVSMWGVRISLAALLAPSMGLRGVWLAMCLELTFRGVIFLVKLLKFSPTPKRV